MADEHEDVPPWIEALALANGEDALARARRRERARKAGKGLWAAVGPDADPELASTPGHDARPLAADEAGPADAQAVWLPLDGSVGGQGDGKV